VFLQPTKSNSRQKAINEVNNKPFLAKICDKLSKYYYKQAGW
jgi:hypothetical protein